jgi:hypothetical protein
VRTKALQSFTTGKLGCKKPGAGSITRPRRSLSYHLVCYNAAVAKVGREDLRPRRVGWAFLSGTPAGENSGDSMLWAMQPTHPSHSAKLDGLSFRYDQRVFQGVLERRSVKPQHTIPARKHSPVFGEEKNGSSSSLGDGR